MTDYPEKIQAGAFSFRHFRDGRYYVHGPATISWSELVTLSKEIKKHERNQRKKDNQVDDVFKLDGSGGDGRA